MHCRNMRRWPSRSHRVNRRVGTAHRTRTVVNPIARAMIQSLDRAIFTDRANPMVVGRAHPTPMLTQWWWAVPTLR